MSEALHRRKLALHFIPLQRVAMKPPTTNRSVGRSVGRSHRGPRSFYTWAYLFPRTQVDMYSFIGETISLNARTYPPRPPRTLYIQAPRHRGILPTHDQHPTLRTSTTTTSVNLTATPTSGRSAATPFSIPSTQPERGADTGPRITIPKSEPRSEPRTIS